jgi:hypothetical protein
MASPSLAVIFVDVVVAVAIASTAASCCCLSTLPLTFCTTSSLSPLSLLLLLMMPRPFLLQCRGVCAMVNCLLLLLLLLWRLGLGAEAATAAAEVVAGAASSASAAAASLAVALSNIAEPSAPSSFFSSSDLSTVIGAEAATTAFAVSSPLHSMSSADFIFMPIMFMSMAADSSFFTATAVALAVSDSMAAVLLPIREMMVD